MWNKYGKEKIDLSEIPFPIPTTLITIIWMGIGITLAREIGKNLDHEIQETDWYKSRSLIWKLILGRIMDATHHWYIGALIMLAYPHDMILYIGTMPVALYWFGLGVLIDDAPDIPPRIQKLLQYWFKPENGVA